MLPIDDDGERPPLRDILPTQAIPHGGTIIRPGAVAWGGMRDSSDAGYPSCEAIERALATATRDTGQLPTLLAELARTRLWVPLPIHRRPFTDGAAIRLPLVRSGGTDFVPCFTSVQRLTTWVDAAPPVPDAATVQDAGAQQDQGTAHAPAAVPGDSVPTARPPADSGEYRPIDAGRWRRAGDARVVPHIVVPATGLAGRLPTGTGLAINPDSVPGIPLYPECVPYLARLAATEPAADGGVSLGLPPAEPVALLDAVRAALRPLPAARDASRAWLDTAEGAGLVIAVTLDDPACEETRRNVITALEDAVTAVSLRVPFPVDATFPGEPVPGEPGPDAVDDWIARNTRPFYTRA